MPASLSATAKLSEGVTFEEASSFPVNAATSAAALLGSSGFDFAAPFPECEADPTADLSSNGSRAIVVIGGGSNVGKLTIQFARIAKVRRVITVASASNDAHLRTLGATHVIDRHLSNEAIVAEVRKALNDANDGALSVYDCVSWDFSLAISIVSPTEPSVIACLHPAEKL